MPDLKLRERLLAAVAVAAAEKDGAGAATLAVQTMAAGDEQDRALVSIVQRWGQNAPHAAAAWLARWPDTPTRDGATQNLVALWTVQDSHAAFSWLNGLPEGALRNAGFLAYGQAVADADVSAAPAPDINPGAALTDRPAGQ
jgi:hypothetical protein